MSDHDPVEARVLVQVRLPKSIVKELDHICIDWDLNRTQLVEQLLREGIARFVKKMPDVAPGGFYRARGIFKQQR
jgi:hypothetical protein